MTLRAWNFLVFLIFLSACRDPDLSDLSELLKINFLDLSSASLKYHVVNLDVATNRLKLMTDQLQLANIPFNRISAVLGKGKPDSFFEDLVSRGILDKKT